MEKTTAEAGGTMENLSEFLQRSGYRRISLTRNEAGHLQVPGSLSGRPLSILLDTGASCTLVNLALARELNLKLNLLDDKGGGAGNASMDVYTVEDGRLELAEVSIRPHALLAMDLSHANEALVTKGVAPVEAILGLDVLETHTAVIDYGSQSLFLRE